MSFHVIILQIKFLFLANSSQPKEIMDLTLIKSNLGILLAD